MRLWGRGAMSRRVRQAGGCLAPKSMGPCDDRGQAGGGGLGSALGCWVGGWGGELKATN